jgi:hypothetical protein
MEHLPQRSAADAALAERVVGYPLEHLDVLTALGARVLVGRHE